MRWSAVVATLALCIVACHSAPPATSAPASATTAAARPMERVVVEPMTVRPATGDSALRAFRPDVPPVDSGGQCRLTRSAGSGATTVLAFFPSADSSRATMMVTFDSAGHLVRFSDIRGARPYRTPPGTTEAQHDSIRRAADAAQRRTSISLDFASDMGVAMNMGGGRPNQGVTGTVRAIERLEQLGPPMRRIERLRRLCGV